MKKVKSILSILWLSTVLAGCGSDDKPDNPYEVFDWGVTKSIYTKQNGKPVLERAWNDTIYRQTLEYVKIEKINFEKRSTQYTTYKFAYQKLN